MRLVTALTLAVLLAACGGDEPEPVQQQPQPAQQQRPRPQPAQQPAQQPAAQAPEPEPEPEPEPQPTMDQKLYSVQVGAFVNQATADEWAGRLRRQNLPVWTSVAEIGGQTYHRLRMGALPSVSDTRKLAEMLSKRYEWPVWVAPLTPADRLPVNAVQNTRSVLQTLQSEMQDDAMGGGMEGGA